MLFWITAALLTLGACLAVLLPLARRGEPPASARAHDLEVYRDQLAEVERDAARGVIGEAEAEQARAEIGRRILRLGETANGAPQADAGKGGMLRWAALAGVLAVPLISWGVYGGLGSPGMPSQPLQARLEGNSLEALVARAEAHLTANPSDGRGWDVVAPIYLGMGRQEDSVEAFQNAIRLLGSSAAREAGLGEALTVGSQGKVGADAQTAFERALAHEPGNARARYYLAIMNAQQGRTDEAAAQWRALAEAEPEESPWRQAAQAALRQVSAADRTGPAQADIEAAAAMSAEDRGAMIEGMVASLDERLRQNPRDGEGWKRLIRSYMVLGQEDEARAALERGIDALGAGTDEAVELEVYAATLQLRETGE